MPVPVHVLKEAAKPLAQRVLDLLESDSQNGYSIEEIYSRLEGVGDDQLAMILRLAEEGHASDRLKEYESAIERLVAEEHVTTTQYDGKTYYYCEIPV